MVSEHNSAFNLSLEALKLKDPTIADRYEHHHPGTAFEEYCLLNPDALECRIYED
jgi:hypothetical protein